MKKKICFIVSSPATAKSFLDNLFSNLYSTYDLYLVANLIEGNHSSYENIFLKKIMHIPIFRKINLVHDVNALFKLSSYLRKEKFDLIITFTPKAGLIGMLSGYIAKIDLRVHFFTGQVWHTKTGLYKKLLMFLDKVVVWGATDILVDGRPQQNYLEQNHIIRESSSKVLGRGTISGIDLKRFLPSPEVRARVREELGYKDSEIVLMFLGRINVDKGILELLDAFKKLEKTHDNVKLLLVGPIEADLIHLFNTNPVIKGNVHYFGATSNPHVLLQACDIFCLPSHREAFGLSIIEASACEKPIICSDTYGLKDTVLDGTTGLTHVTHDSNSLLYVMSNLVDNPLLRREMGVNGRRFVEKYFSRDYVTMLWAEYLKGLFK